VNCVAPRCQNPPMEHIDKHSIGAARPLEGLALEQLEAVICQGAANLSAAERDWLLAVAEFDRREGWACWGVVSSAAWLSWQVGPDLRAAREKVRVARSLLEFPLISAAMGFLSPRGRSVSAAQPVFTGRHDTIDAHQRTAKDGRCRWGGEQLDLDLALTALFSRRDNARLVSAKT